MKIEDIIDIPELVLNWWELEGSYILFEEPLFVDLSRKILEERKHESNS